MARVRQITPRTQASVESRRTCALVLGGYVNGYNIIRALYEEGIREIVLFDTLKRLGRFSNKIILYRQIEKSHAGLLNAIRDLLRDYDYVVIFPTDDLQIRWLHKIYHCIAEDCFIPFNYSNVLDLMNKYQQYRECERLGIPYPKTIFIEAKEELDKITEIGFPLLLKPSTRLDMVSPVFRSLKLSDMEEYKEHRSEISNFLEQDISFIASEIIPGKSSDIYAYTGYRSHDGAILGEWVGRKLSQYPDDFGVFASASNEAPDIIHEQGRAILEGMDLFGINQPEFKYDKRDGLYKLTEINLRSMMWHRMGKVSGVNLPYVQYLDAIGKTVPVQHQRKDAIVHFSYFKHEIGNLLGRKKYSSIFFHNLFGKNKIYFAVFDYKDVVPFLYDLTKVINMVGRRILRLLITQVQKKCNYKLHKRKT